MRFEEAYEGWSEGRLTQAEAARILGMYERSFRRYLVKYEADCVFRVIVTGDFAKA